MPAEISLQITGVMANMRVISTRIEEQVLEALDQSAAMVARDAKDDHPFVREEIQGLAADAYRVKNWAKTGEYAGTYRFLTRTGLARNSIIPRRAHKTATGYTALVVSGVEYSDDLEFGTVDRRPFPFMRPALITQRDATVRRLERAVKRGVEGS